MVTGLLTVTDHCRTRQTWTRAYRPSAHITTSHLWPCPETPLSRAHMAATDRRRLRHVPPTRATATATASAASNTLTWTTRRATRMARRPGLRRARRPRRINNLTTTCTQVRMRFGSTIQPSISPNSIVTPTPARCSSTRPSRSRESTALMKVGCPLRALTPPTCACRSPRRTTYRPVRVCRPTCHRAPSPRVRP